MTSKTLNIYEIKTRFSYYAKLVLKGRSFIIAHRNRPFAELRPLETALESPKLKFGLFPEKIEIPKDFNAPLDDFESSFYRR